MSGIHSESTQFPPTATTDTGMQEFRMIQIRATRLFSNQRLPILQLLNSCNSCNSFPFSL
jgi:hypothetical protein